MSDRYAQDVRELAGLHPATGQELVVRDGEVLDPPTLADLRETIIGGSARIDGHVTKALLVAFEVGEALIAAKSMMAAEAWLQWCNGNLPLSQSRIGVYIRIATFRRELPDDICSIDAARRFLDDAGLERSRVHNRLDQATHDEVRRLRDAGLSYREIGEQIGKHQSTVHNMLNPHVHRHRQSTSRARRRAASAALRRQEQDKAVRASPFSHIYADIHKLTDKVGAFADNAATKEQRAIANAALARLHEARDEIVRGVGIA